MSEGASGSTNAEPAPEVAPAAEGSAGFVVGLALLLLVTAWTYAPLRGAGFALDDFGFVVGNRALEGGQLGAFLRGDLWSGAAVGEAAQASGYYRPLVLLSLALDRSWWGADPAGFHLQSVAWHLLATTSVAWVCRSLLGPRAALVGATWFALHPVQSEAVAWIAARNDLMVTTWGGIALGCLLPAGASRLRLLVGALTTLLAVLSKESAVTLPVALLAFDVVTSRRGLRRHLAAWVGVLAALGLRGWAAPLRGDHALALSHLGASMLVTPAAVVWPHPLSPMRVLGDPVPLGTLGLGGGVLVVLLAWAWAGRRRRPMATVGVLWFLCAWAPSIAATAWSGNHGDRYLYLPMMGLAVLVAGLAASRPRLARVLAVAGGLSGAALVRARLPDWHDGLSITGAMARDLPSSFTHGLHAETLQDLGRGREALMAYERALGLRPVFAKVCGKSVALALELGEPRQAQRLGELGEGSGCRQTPNLSGLRAYAHAATGEWDRARSLLPSEPDPAGRDLVVGAVLAARAGDPHAIDALRAQWARAEPVDRWLAPLLALPVP